MDGGHAGERGALRKEPGGRLGVALVYPNVYRIGMANLGVHAVYRLLNADPGALCERVFLPEDGAAPRSVESGRPLSAFDVVAFTLSFEDDYPNVLALLERAGLPLRAAARDERHPLVVAGGRGQGFAEETNAQNINHIGRRCGVSGEGFQVNGRAIDLVGNDSVGEVPAVEQAGGGDPVDGGVGETVGGGPGERPARRRQRDC